MSFEYFIYKLIYIYLIFKIFNKNKQMNGFYHIIGFCSNYLIAPGTTTHLGIITGLILINFNYFYKFKYIRKIYFNLKRFYLIINLTYLFS